MKRPARTKDNSEDYFLKLIKNVGLQKANWKRNRGLKLKHKYLGNN